VNEAKKYMPGGTTAGNKKAEPIIAWDGAKGSYLWDVEGKRYIDYHGSWGPTILGHADEYVTGKAIEAMKKYDVFGVGVTEPEIELCKRLTEIIPSAEKVLMTVSGSEATYLALRVSRSHTGRQKILKFQGCYHGYYDAVLRNVATVPEKLYKRDPGSNGMLDCVIDNTVIARLNDLESVADAVKKNKGEIAGIIIEPLGYNLNGVVLDNEFLAGVRKICDEEGIVFIFDEVVTGFRAGFGSYESICGVHPDLITMGKAIANGYQIAVLMGKSKIMDRFDSNPSGDTVIQGTFNGNPAMAAAAVATIERLSRPGFYEELYKKADYLRAGFSKVVSALGLDEKITVSGYGPASYISFGKGPFRSYDDVAVLDHATGIRFRQEVVKRGSYFVPVDYKRISVFESHSYADLDETINAVEDALKTVKSSIK
jgi:glutamate-1-semialdehyde 2,1-aminomutase